MNDNYFDMDITAPDLLPLNSFINDFPSAKNPEMISLQQEISNLSAKVERLILRRCE